MEIAAMIAAQAPLRAPMNHALRAARRAPSGGFALKFCRSSPVAPAKAETPLLARILAEGSGTPASVEATVCCFRNPEYASFPVVTIVPP
jgi:hypothetical protein